jgi:hypothetical protein
MIATALDLHAGVNRVGRNPLNDIQIEDSSVSGYHCEIICEGDAVRVRDLNSTNGTCIDGQLITEGVLVEGQTLRVGNVDLALEPNPVTIAVPTLPLPEGAVQAASDGVHCQHHPHLLATHECTKCGLIYCEDCVRGVRRLGGATLQFCPSCDGRCVSIRHRKAPGAGRVPMLVSFLGAFRYPFIKQAVFLLAAATLFYTLVDYLVAYSFGFGWGLALAATGYWFASIRNIILSSGQGEDEVPAWPEVSSVWDDLLRPALECIALVLVAFGPAMIGDRLLSTSAPEARLLLVPLISLGCFYFPMALLGIAMLDSLAALNPVFILRSIFRVPVAYLAACALTAVAIGVGLVGDELLRRIWIPLLPALVSNFVSIYLAMVVARILGLLFYFKRDRLGWV